MYYVYGLRLPILLQDSPPVVGGRLRDSNVKRRSSGRKRKSINDFPGAEKGNGDGSGSSKVKPKVEAERES